MVNYIRILYLKSLTGAAGFEISFTDSPHKVLATFAAPKLKGYKFTVLRSGGIVFLREENGHKYFEAQAGTYTIKAIL